MRILHISDQHGRIPTEKAPKDIDVIVCTGDLLPNSRQSIFGKSKSQVEAEFQTQWVKDHLEQFKHWIGEIPFFFVSGNHDYIDPIPLLQQEGIDAQCLNERFFTFQGLKFYGFPYVNPTPSWNFGLAPNDMEKKVREIVRFCNHQGIDVLACHAPFFQTLDFCPINYQNYGIRAMKNAIDNEIIHLPKAYLAGHVHLANKVISYKNMIVSNAAEVQNIIEI